MTQTNSKTKFEQLTAIDCSTHIEKKKNGGTELSYLSWSWAWDYFKKAYPDAKYEIREWDGKPYLFDETLGYMVETAIEAGGEKHIMWLPVMDGANRAMKDKPYTVVTKYNKFEVAAATMFDINKTVMRCLVKNMAMFGLGLYIYAGEDLPAGDDADEKPKEKPVEKKKLDEAVPLFEKKTQEFLTLDEYKKRLEKCATHNDIQLLLNSQRGNMYIAEMARLATARKENIDATQGA